MVTASDGGVGEGDALESDAGLAELLSDLTDRAVVDAGMASDTVHWWRWPASLKNRAQNLDIG